MSDESQRPADAAGDAANEVYKQLEAAHSGYFQDLQTAWMDAQHRFRDLQMQFERDMDAASREADPNEAAKNVMEKYQGEYANLMKEADPSKGYAAAFEKYRNTIKDLMAKAEAAHLDVATVMHISSSLNAVATHAAVLNWSGPTT